MKNAKEIASTIREMINARFMDWDMSKETMEQYWARKKKVMDEIEEKLANLLT